MNANKSYHTVVKCAKCGKRIHGKDIAAMDFRLRNEKGKLVPVCGECDRKRG